MRRSKLSADQAALLREDFPTIRASHRELVCNLLPKLDARVAAAAALAAAEHAP